MSEVVAKIDVGDLLDPEVARNGPVDVLWNQDEWIPCNRVLQTPPIPRRPWWARLLRMRPFFLLIRLEPGAGDDLADFGRRVSKRLGVRWDGPPRDEDRAVWLPGGVFAWNAGRALASSRRIFERLDGLNVVRAQVRALVADSE